MEFLGQDFLLDNEYAKKLYHDYAKDMPIFDFHCHLSPKEIYEDKAFSSLTEAWLAGDHYKWRLLRQAGVAEEYITGNKPDYERFLRFAEVVPQCAGNPMYHWVHLELRRFFGIELILKPETAAEIYRLANEQLKTLTARRLIESSGVTALCTTDDPSDTLEYHKALKDAGFKVKVLPSYRPDKYLNIGLDTFIPAIKRLEKCTGSSITDIKALAAALVSRLEYFKQLDCVCSDHALDTVGYAECSKEEADKIFKSALRGSVSAADSVKYKSYLLVLLAGEYKRLGIAQQYHIGALRNVNSRMKARLGADTGYDCIEDSTFAEGLARLLDAEDAIDSLPKTVLYCLNPRDNEVLAAMANCFQGGGAGKIQFGSAWWFNDQLDGMNRQMEALSQLGLISRFIGMLTDSRSFLSYPRHEYFRRLLCKRLGALVVEGAYPKEELSTLGNIVRDVCYNNAVEYFSLKL